MSKKKANKFWHRVFKPACYGERESCEERVTEVCPNHKGCASAYFKRGMKEELNFVQRFRNWRKKRHV